NRTLDEDETLLGVDGLHDEVLHGHAVAAHAARHLLTAEHTTRSRRAADRTRLAVVAVRTVRCGNALEVVALHGACEALALRGADDVDLLTGFEGALERELLAEAVLRGVGRADLGEVTARG